MTLTINKLHDTLVYARSHYSQILVHSATDELLPYSNPPPPYTQWKLPKKYNNTEFKTY